MKFKPEGFIEWGRWGLSQLVWLAVFTSFASGVFTQNILLGILPLIVHQVIGWIGIGTTILFTIAEIVGWKL